MKDISELTAWREKWMGENGTCCPEMPQKGGGASEVGPAAQPAAASEQITLQDLVNQLSKSREMLGKQIEEKLAPVSLMLQKHEQQLGDLEKRTNEVEHRVTVVEADARSFKEEIQALKTQVCNLHDQVDDLANRGRRKNIWIIGLPEDKEGERPAEFVEDWLQKFLDLETGMRGLKIEKAHRVAARRSGLGQHPRPFLVRFHHYRDKVTVMEASRLQGKDSKGLIYEGSEIMFFQGFSVAVIQKQKSYDGVKRRLKELGIQYSLR
ncbi:uncharacterized protein LOC132832698 isoform X2 [Hemiscyllium ocellatum]|uniref:uncharacterized protein LOC132832698 isoform X2 n=1 Tax=Hemiscyllium ocellatum TaxID=170820 RepID=UPI002966F931|nr:uncharacterized protein LOC132832698 isoform X2 [Hemiscyllium ocellatum]